MKEAKEILGKYLIKINKEKILKYPNYLIK